MPMEGRWTDAIAIGCGFFPAHRIGRVALLGQSGFTRGRRQRDGPAHSGRMGQQSGQLWREVPRRVRFGAQFDHRRREANQMRGM